MTATVAIIGAGPAGLASAKTALDYGLIPIVFEAAGEHGGVWRGRGTGVWPDMRVNISRHTTRFSDFPWDDTEEDFPLRSGVFSYLKSYATHFGLEPFVRYGTQVVRCSRTPAGWTLLLANGESVQSSHLIIASGVFARESVPHLPGLEMWKDRSIHSRSYQGPDEFKGKRVAVVGNAFSGAQIAADLSRVADSVVNVFRRKIWIIPRYLKNGLPIDLGFYNRKAAYSQAELSEEECNRRTHRYFLDEFGDPGSAHPMLSMPAESSASPFVTISDDYLDRVAAGAVIPVIDEIRSLDHDGIILQEFGRLDVDRIIWCTGFKPDLGFLEAEVSAMMNYDPSDPQQPICLGRTIFVAGIENLACVGLYRGPYFATMELQARLACAKFAGERVFTPAQVNGWQEEEMSIRKEHPRKQFPHGDYVLFSDQLAELLGVLPCFSRSESDPLWTKPHLPMNYRLNGRHANPDRAAQEIEEVYRKWKL